MSKPLRHLDGDIQFSTGQNVQLCAIHELNPAEYYSIQASMTIGGMSVCSMHFLMVADMLVERAPLELIIIKAQNGDL